MEFMKKFLKLFLCYPFYRNLGKMQSKVIIDEKARWGKWLVWFSMPC